MYYGYNLYVLRIQFVCTTDTICIYYGYNLNVLRIQFVCITDTIFMYYGYNSHMRLFYMYRIRWAELVARIGVGEAYSGFWWGNLREKGHLGGPGVDGMIILR